MKSGQIILFVSVVTVYALRLGAAAEPSRISLSPLPAGQWEEVPGAARPGLVAISVATPPQIDGRLDDPCWTAAKRIETFAEISGVPAGAAKWVSVQAAYDANALYIAGRLAKPSAQLRATVRETGGRVWLDDALEIYLYDPAQKTLYQLDLNALGAWWAGVEKAGADWKPSPTVSAVMEDAGWTFEAALPWKDLGVGKPGDRALNIQFRYLVNNQSGFTSWVAADRLKPEAFGELVLGAERQDMVVLRRFLFPRQLPVGVHDKAIGIEVENTGNVERTVGVRLYDVNVKTGKQENVVTFYPKIAPKAMQKVFLKTTIPDSTPPDGAKTLLYWSDGHFGGSNPPRLYEQRRIETLPPVRFRLNRERLWAGDPSVTGRLDIGADDAARAAGSVRIEFGNRRRILSEQAISPITATRYDVTLDLKGLDPGAYQLAVTFSDGKRGHDMLSDLTVNAGESLPERQRIALFTNFPQGFALADPVPLYAGVSFPAGMLADESNVRVVEKDGMEIPCQSEVLTRWSPGGTIQWLSLRFQGKRGAAYSVEVGRAVNRAAVPGPTLKVEEDAQRIVVDTGAARFEAPKSGPLLGKAWVGGKQVLDGGSACLLVADQNKRVADETRSTPDEAPVIETAGPLHAVIRREGSFRLPTGERLGKYVVRMAFDAGQPFVRVQHTFINTEDSNTFQYSDIAVRVKPSLGGPWAVALDDAPAHDGKSYAAAVNPAQQEGAYLFQAAYPHHTRTESKCVVGLRKGGEWKEVETIPVAGEWASVANGGVGAALTIRNLAVLFPKELEVGPDGLTAHLWSSRGGRNLDYRASTLADYYGKDWVSTSPEGADGFRKIYTNAAGTARTHDLCLHLFSDPASVAAVSQWADQPALIVQDPAWLNRSDAMGPLHPLDPQQFPRAENLVRSYFREYVEAQIARSGDYGFLDFGNGPHTYANPDQKAWKLPRFYRYYGTDYQFRTSVWLLYARSGDRMYFDYGDAWNRGLSDYNISHYPVKGRPLGAPLTLGYSNSHPLYWSGIDMVHSQGQDIQNFMYQYYLTGDRYMADAIRLSADYMKGYDPLILPNVGAAANHVPYMYLAFLYAHTWDERFGEKLRMARERLVDPDTSTGVVDQDYYGAWYKYQVRVLATLTDWIVTGAADCRKALEKGLELALLRDGTPPGTMGYEDNTGLYAAYGYRLSRDRRYVSYMAERLGRMEFENSREDGQVLDGKYLGPWNPRGLQTIVVGLDLLAREKDKISPWPTLSAGPPIYPVGVVFGKNPHEAIRFDLVHDRGFDLLLDTLRDPKDEIRRGGYFIGSVSLDANPSYFTKEPGGPLGGGFAALTLPKEVLPAQYRMTHVRTVLSTDARQLVMVAPEGVYLEAGSSRPPRWHFLVPKGKNGALFVDRPSVLERTGKEEALPPCAWIELKGGAEDQMAALRVNGLTYVRFRGDIPAVLAQDDPSLFFVPAKEAMPSPLGALEDAASAFVPGASGLKGDRALLLNGNRVLSLPRGQKTGDRAYELVDYNHGTLELWFKPQWTAALSPSPKPRNLLRPSNWELSYRHALTDELTDSGGRTVPTFNCFFFRAISAAAYPQPKYPYVHFELVQRTPMNQGIWRHLALCWDYQPGSKIWTAELYIDGQPSGGGLDNRTAQRVAAQPRERTEGYHNWDAADPAPFEFPGEFNAVVDSIRVSNVPRYRQAFSPPREPMALDDATLLLAPLDGTLQAQSSRKEGPIAVTVTPALPKP